MKIIFILFISIHSFFFVSAQLTKSHWLIGGTGTFLSRNGTYTTPIQSYESKYTDLTLSPNVGYFIIDKFAVGVRPSLSWIKSKAYPPGGGTTNLTRFVAGPFVRYYVLDPDKQFNLVTEGSIQFGRYKAGPDKGTITNYSFLAGPVIFLNTSVGLELLLGYTSATEDVDDRYKNTLRGFQVQLGFQFHLEN